LWLGCGLENRCRWLGHAATGIHCLKNGWFPLAPPPGDLLYTGTNGQYNEKKPASTLRRRAVRTRPPGRVLEQLKPRAGTLRSRTRRKVSIWPHRALKESMLECSGGAGQRPRSLTEKGRAPPSEPQLGMRALEEEADWNRGGHRQLGERGAPLRTGTAPWDKIVEPLAKNQGRKGRCPKERR